MRHPDAIILGGGIIGVALAEELARHGRRVVLIERGRVGAEASSAAAGILSAQMDLPRPGPLFDLCQAARRMYPRWITHLERRSGVPVEFHVDGILYLAVTASQERRMDRQLAWQRQHGLRVERWSPTEVRRHEPAVDGRIRRGYLFPTEAQVDNAALMRALAIAARKAGVEIRERTSLRRVLIRAGRVRGVDTDRGRIEARHVVNCLGSWAAMGGRFPARLPVEPVRGQILAFRGPQRLLRHAVMSDQAYAVQRRDGRLLVGSTLEHAGFEKAVTLAGMTAILRGWTAISSALASCRFEEAWAGFRPYVPDRLPILGATQIDGLFVATAHYRHGILLAPVTAALMVEFTLRGRPPVALTLFSPTRF